jgi:hypothetical protein
VAALLQATATVLRSELAALPDDLTAWRPAPGEWSANEVVGHLSEADRHGFANRIEQLLGEENPRFASWDQEAVACARHDEARPLADLLAEFERVRAASVQLVAGLQAQDLTRSGLHAMVGRLTVRDLLHEWVHHDREHLCQVLATVQAAVWPAMGNARRFSQPELPEA